MQHSQSLVHVYYALGSCLIQKHYIFFESQKIRFYEKLQSIPDFYFQSKLQSLYMKMFDTKSIE